MLLLKYPLSILTLFFVMETTPIFKFSNTADIQDWKIIDDVVMGGMTSSIFSLNDEGFGVFTGTVSLENNGGFASVRYRFNKINVSSFKKIKIRLKGDGKNYQFRVKDDSKNYFSYISSFPTSNSWQVIEIDLKDMFPSFRGNRLNLPNFSNDFIEEIMFLIGNKKKENFILTIDSIELI